MSEDQEPRVKMTVKEAGSKGGKRCSELHGREHYARMGRMGGGTTSARLGRDHYVRIGKMGGARVRELIQRGRKHEGFTIIELLVVIGIILVLAGILFPVFARARRLAQATVCVSQERQIGEAMRMYAQDYDERLPLGAYHSSSAQPILEWDVSWHDLLLPYVNENPAVFKCPAAKFSDLRYSYGCNPWLSGYYSSVPMAMVGAGERVWSADHATGDFPIRPWDYGSDPLHLYLFPRHDGWVAVVYLDGHVAMRRPEDLLMSGGMWLP